MKHVGFIFAALALGVSVPAAAQNFPLAYGDYVEMTSVSIDDGHNMDYANFLTTKWKAQEDFAKAQGWITGYEILANPWKRAGEPDLYLVVRFRSTPDAAEQVRRDQIMRDHVKMDDTQMDAGAADRAKFRHVTGSELLQVLAFK
ncbi:MAG: hypothetical protein M3N34_09710 [Pseudomonadota bacterium]|nr:hypothetical protein [Pseudomonadota bacterium]